MKKGIIFIVIMLFAIFDVSADPQSFVVPNSLKGRVNFWVGVFTKYGRHHYVIHHRAFPQVVFKVLNFNPYASTMSAVQLERYKERVKSQEVKKILDIAKRFSLGYSPRNGYENEIWNKLIKLPGGKSNFGKVYKDKLVRAQAGIKEEFCEAIKRSGKYIGIMERIFVQEYNLPIELTRIPFVESSFNYKASSAVGAAGIWQFMRRTGVSLGMTVNNAIDERRDPIVATRAAAKYLKSNYSRLGSWALAITAYNHGASGVARKVREYGSKDIAYIVEHPNKRLLGFASNNFYAEFLAALEVYKNRKRYFPNISQDNQLSFFQYPLHYPIKVSEVSRRFNISIEELQQYNYALTSKTLAGYYMIPRGYKIKLPTRLDKSVSLLNTPDKSVRYAVAQPASKTWDRYYTVRAGDSLGGIANHFSLKISELKRLNGIRGDRIVIGQRLLVSRKNLNTSSNVRTSNTSTITYKVRSGDSLISIANKYKISVTTLKNFNGLKNNIIKIGQSLKIPSQGNVQSSNLNYSNVGSVVYTVRKGDTLLNIAIKYGVSVNALKQSNNLKSSLLSIGQKLRIPLNQKITAKSTSNFKSSKKVVIRPATRVYRVKQGDTLWSISKKYGVSIDTLKRLNNVSGRAGIKAGQTIVLY